MKSYLIIIIIFTLFINLFLLLYIYKNNQVETLANNFPNNNFPNNNFPNNKKNIDFKINPNAQIKILNIYNDYNVVVIDNFLLNFNDFSNDNFYDSFTKEYLEDASILPEHPYPGEQYLINISNKNDIENKIKKMVGNSLPKFNKTRLNDNNNFSIGKKFKRENPFTTNPHIDEETRYNYAVLLYLNKPGDCHGGTGIYKSKVLDNITPRVNGELIPQEKFVSLYEKTDIIKDSTDKWELIHLFKMKPNRLIIYESSLFHSIYLDSFDLFKKYRYTFNLWFNND
jgi:hypothetical protein